MRTTIADQLRLPRLAHVLVEAIPGTALRLGRQGGSTVLVAPPDDRRAEVLLCQHRAALARALEADTVNPYVEGLGLTAGGELTIDLLAPIGADLGSGVLTREEPDGRRRILTVTTLPPRDAAGVVRAARTVPRPAHDALTREPGLADLVLEIAHDRPLGVTLLSWCHRPHPAVVGAVEDVARAASAACAVEELLRDVAG